MLNAQHSVYHIIRPNRCSCQNSSYYHYAYIQLTPFLPTKWIFWVTTMSSNFLLQQKYSKYGLRASRIRQPPWELASDTDSQSDLDLADQKR